MFPRGKNLSCNNGELLRPLSSPPPPSFLLFSDDGQAAFFGGLGGSFVRKRHGPFQVFGRDRMEKQ